MASICRRQTEKQTLALLLGLIPVLLPMVSAIPQEPEAVEAWFKNLGNAKEQITKLHFYWHDTFSGKNPSSIPIAKPSTNPPSPSFFGYTAISDDPLTAGPESGSKLVGRAQGLFASADQHEVGLLMALNYEFTEGKFNGSTLTLLGRNPITHLHREMSIVGGTGVFRLARGIATAKTYSYNLTTGDAVVEYNVVVIHY